jgi:predicted RNA polymerase sigma factor
VIPRPLVASSEHLLRELAPQVLGAVIRRFRDFTAAEDEVQEALAAASIQWPRVPDNPHAWLIQVASRRMTDHLRSERARRRRETAAAMQLRPESTRPLRSAVARCGDSPRHLRSEAMPPQERWRGVHPKSPLP